MVSLIVWVLTGVVVFGAAAFVARHLHQLRTGAQAPDREHQVWWIPGNGRHGGT